MYTESEREQLVKQYVPLVKKITNQLYAKFKNNAENANITEFDYESLEGYAWEGFVIAMNKYNPERSSQTFTQFAAYNIRYSILNGINTCSRNINVSYYMIRKMKEKGEEQPSTVSISRNIREDHERELGYADNVMFDNPWETLINKLNAHFPTDWVEMFMYIYGLDRHEVLKSTEIAKKFNVSPALVTIRKNKIIDYIKQDADMLDILSELL